MTELWLIRKPGFEIQGPLEKPILFEKLRKGEFDPSVEICPENGHWFYLYEVEEMKRHFPVDAVIFSTGAESRSSAPGDKTDTSVIHPVSDSLKSPQGWLGYLLEAQNKYRFVIASILFLLFVVLMKLWRLFS